MLNVILKNHDFKYEVAELIKLFTSDFQFVENKSFGMVLENTLLEYNNTLISTSKYYENYELRFESSENIKIDGLSEQELKKRTKEMIKRSMFNVLKKKFNTYVPWGILTGIRPVKIVHNLLDKGMSDEYIRENLKENYLIMDEKIDLALEIAKRESAMLEKTDKVEKVLQQAARVLATNTNYATMVSSPINNRNTLKFIQLSQVDAEQIVAVIVLGGNVIKNKIIEVGEMLSNENLLKLNMLLNTTLNGLPIDQITLGLIARLKEQAGIHSEVVAHVLDAVAETIHVEEDMKIYTSGATNIFKYPELSDKQSAQEIISAFEEKQQLADLVTETLASEDSHGIQVYIGDETPVKTMKDCSVVTATYELGEGMKGTIGIIGPKRMDYEHVMKTLKILQGELDAIYNKDPKG